jgi:hypothetical protein
MAVHALARAGYPVSDRCGTGGESGSAAGGHVDQDADKSPTDFRFWEKLGSKAGVVE